MLNPREKARRGKGWKEERQEGREEGKGGGRRERRKEEGKERRQEGEREGGTINQEVRKDAVSIRAFQRNKTNSITHYASNFIKKFISSCSSNQLKELVISKSIGQASRLESQAVVNAIIWRENLLFIGQISLFASNAFN